MSAGRRKLDGSEPQRQAVQMSVPPESLDALERGDRLTPRFDGAGLVPCVATDAASGEVLMLAYMNAEALERTLATGEAHYWSRSRGELWRKGATSGQIQRVEELRVDCDQDAVWIKVRPLGDGGACHVGYRSCFYRVAETTPDGVRLALRPRAGS